MHVQSIVSDCPPTRNRSHRVRHGLIAVAIVVVGAASLTGCVSALQQQQMDLVNSYRTSNSKPTLTADAQAMEKAQAWAQHMATSGVVEHTGGGAALDRSGVVGCGYVENVGTGASLDAIQASFVATSSTKANLLSSSHRIGTGVVQSGSVFWVTEIFLRDCTAAGAVAISGGQAHTCAVNGVGGALCWGLNANGQLGRGSRVDSLVPVAVSGLSSGVTAISAGANHTCAVAGGAAKCWGANDRGQLGNGTTTESTAPVTVSGLGSGVIAIAAGNGYSCAITTAGAAKCWGANDRGQLGNGTTDASRVPVDVIGLTSGVSQISVGSGMFSHTCAVTSAGAALCWGANGDAELGDGSDYDSFEPIGVYALNSGVASIDVGNSHTCAVTTAGAAKCWGYNAYGQIGDGTDFQAWVPTAVTGLSSGVRRISAGMDRTCAVTTAGATRCWGYNGDGELGNGTTTNSKVPVAVSGLTSGTATVADGDYQGCATTYTGVARCWGSNGFGQIGNNTTNSSLTPVGVSGLTGG